MGKPFDGRQLDLENARTGTGREKRGALELPHAFSVETGGNRFSDAQSEAWKDALHSAEQLLEQKSGGKGGTAGAAPGSENGAGGDVSVQELLSKVDQSEISLDDLIVELEAAEADSKESPERWRGLLNEVQMDSRADRDLDLDDYDRRRRRSSGSASQYSISDVPVEILSERAAQWGYGVALKTSRDSSPRTSDGSFSNNQMVPGVARDVQDALASFQLAFLVCDATERDFPIRYASAGFTTMTGYTSQEIVGKNCRFLQGPDTNREDIAKIRDTLRKGAIYSGTLLNYKKDGTPFWNLLTISPIKDEKGSVIKYIGMQAEQHSKEQQPRNSKGQKSPLIRPLQAPSFTVREDIKAASINGGPAPPNRRHSSNSLHASRPPVPPQRGAASERHSAGAEIHSGENPQGRMSQRYSLSSTPVRSTRNSSVALETPDNHWRDAALKMKEGLERSGRSTSFFESPDVSSKQNWNSQKSKAARLSSKVLRFFRKSTKDSKRPLETVKSGKEAFESSDSEEEGIKESESMDNTTQMPRFRNRSSSVYSSSAGRSSLGPSEKPDSGGDDLGNRFSEELDFGGKNRYGTSSQPALPIGENKRQFCIVHD